MTYTDSIRRILVAEANYHSMCERADTDAAVAYALDIFNRAKAEHREMFGTLRRIAGEWV